ncbi:sensor histidine kinase [Crocosphaera chwakensis]|uniref:Circadian input-output histidine kinase CikA n=1 Tax=Crocosphaera chwakensis CCY0110 TaxID=391612 RepID=A3IV88_9CHRO|nr:sensor histidine kinase [Crocosphaera chwakensis]EAZ89649.1 Histidine Kinase [Crocosphaera chwakensis CCY0110]
MNDIGYALLTKIEIITDDWIGAIRTDIEIESAKGLAYKSVRNSIPYVVEALASLLSESLKDKPKKLERKGLDHGIIRAEQGYDVAEIVREYSLLRTVIISVLKSDLLSGSPEEILSMIEVIDSVIDQVICWSLDSYIEQRLEELEQVRTQLLLTNEELERLIATQKEDISELAHELKTPLNSIIGFSRLLQQQQQQANQDPDTSLNLELTQKVINNGRQLLRLINNVLEISRYEAGKISLNLEPTNLRFLVQAVVEILEPSATQKDLDIRFDFDQTPEQIITDSLRLRQIITNLVSNAIKYTDSGTIEIKCQTENDNQWSLIVTDTGIGISPEDQAQIFKPYYLVKLKNRNLSDRTGLGLTIVDKLVKLLQGEINLVSTPGEGSTFTLTFPVS